MAGNTAADLGPDVRGTVISVGFNLVGRRDDSAGWAGTDLTGTGDSPLDPRLAPLGDYGGPTPTYALRAGSPALRAGDNALRGSLDQRGSEREFTPDIGAFNANPTFRFRFEAPEAVRPGEPFALTLVGFDRWGNRATSYTGTAHFSSTDLAAVLPATAAFAADGLGVHTITVVLNTPGEQSIRAVDRDGFGSPNGTATVFVEEGSRPGPGAGLGVVLAALLRPAERRLVPQGG